MERRSHSSYGATARRHFSLAHASALVSCVCVSNCNYFLYRCCFLQLLYIASLALLSNSKFIHVRRVPESMLGIVKSGGSSIQGSLKYFDVCEVKALEHFLEEVGALVAEIKRGRVGIQKEYGKRIQKFVAYEEEDGGRYKRRETVTQ